MKKTIVLLLCLALALMLVVGGVLWYLFSRLTPPAPKTGGQTVEEYVAESWPDYTLESYDPADGSLRLGLDLRLTYEQLVQYGDQPEMEDLVLGHLDTMEEIARGAQTFCGVKLGTITVTGRSSDGQIAYTASSDGETTACWRK